MGIKWIFENSAFAFSCPLLRLLSRPLCIIYMYKTFGLAFVKEYAVGADELKAVSFPGIVACCYYHAAVGFQLFYHERNRRRGSDPEVYYIDAKLIEI